MYACIHGEGAAASNCAREFSPRVEELDAGTVVVDATGLDRLFGSPAQLATALTRRFAELGFTGSIAIATNPDAAVHAARGLPGVTIIPPGEEPARLAGLPISLLNPSPEIHETLETWGIRTFGDLAALPEIGLAERFGPEGVRLQKLARGQGNRPLRPVEPNLIFEQAIELEYPVTELDPLSFVLSRLLHQLCATLESRALAAIEIRLTLKLDRKPDHVRAIRLPVPIRNVKTLLKLLQLELSAHPPEAPILAVKLDAEPAKPRAAQSGLYTPPAPEAEKLELTLARIAAIVGRENVGVPQLVDTHRPDAFKVGWAPRPAAGPPAGFRVQAPKQALRIYRPPLPATVQSLQARPAHLAASGINGKVQTLAGPWRISGDWWTQAPWARDEWDVALAGGALYRIYFARPAGRWFVEGSYD